MTTMVTEVYDALISAGAEEDKARRAAEVLANYDKEFADIRGDLRVLKWSTSAIFAMVAAGLVKLFLS